MVRLTELIDKLYEPPTAPQTAPAAPWVTVNSDSVFDKFSEAASWADILEPLGWIQVKPGDSVTLEAWQHPNATHPISAHVLRVAPYAIVNWSENSGLPAGADQDLTKAKAYAILNYNGDKSAAAKALAKGEAVNLPAHVVDAVRSRDNIVGTVTEVTANQISGDGESQSARRIRLTPLSSIKPRPVRWAWADRIPAGELTLTPGRGGVGKSTFHAWVIAHLTRGTLPGVHFGTPKPCTIAASEDSYDRTVVPRLMAAGADMDLVYRVDVITETDEVVSITLPRDIDALTAEITRIGVAALSVDPVMSVMSDALDTHKDREVRLGLEPLGRLADRTGCVVLGNAHFNKSSGSDPLSLIMGSAAFGNVARAALGFARDTEDEDGSCVISQAKNNLGRLDLPSLRYRIDNETIDTEEGPAEVGKLVMLGESDRSVADILRDRHTDEDDRSERDEAAAWLLDYLTSEGGSAKAGDAIKAAAGHGIAKATLGRARKRAGVRSAKYGMTGGWVWTLEELTEGTEELKNQRVSSSGSSVSSSGEPEGFREGPCPHCDQPLAAPNSACLVREWHSTEAAT